MDRLPFDMMLARKHVEGVRDLVPAQGRRGFEAPEILVFGQLHQDRCPDPARIPGE
jgi:hypothetical protein